MANHRTFDEAATIVIRVRVTPAQCRDLQDVARENGATISGAIREAVDEFVGDYRENHPVFANRRTPARP
jgi:hypothetical protein